MFTKTHKRVVVSCILNLYCMSDTIEDHDNLFEILKKSHYIYNF